MKKYEVKESFILEAHDNACSEWKNRIEKEGCNVIGFYKGDSGNYGINNGSWSNTINMSAIETWELMTIEEVETALIAEAKKRGFKEGVRFKGVEGVDMNLSIEIGKGKGINGIDSYIFYNGEWATIEEPTKEMTVQELEKELGYKIKIVK